MLENVEEFETWGPLDSEGNINARRKGWYFKCFVGALQRRGYRVEWKILRACDYGAPTIRKRLFLVARCDDRKIVWPDATHGADGLPPYRTAAECIDWSIPCPSIFERKKPLADATCRRIAKGIMRYVVESKNPFIVKVNHTSSKSAYNCFRGQSIDEPLQTITARPGYALVSAFMAKHYGGVTGHDLDRALGTVTTKDHHSVVACLCKLRGSNIGDRVDAPLHTISAGGTHHALVAAFMTKYYGAGAGGQSMGEPFHTVTGRDRFSLITVQIDGQTFVITDIGLRMLQPHELYAAQGFPGNYIIDRGEFKDGSIRKLTKTAQVRMCGNSVSPLVAEALARANCPELIESEAVA